MPYSLEGVGLPPAISSRSLCLGRGHSVTPSAPGLWLHVRLCRVHPPVVRCSPVQLCACAGEGGPPTLATRGASSPHSCGSACGCTCCVLCRGASPEQQLPALLSAHSARHRASVWVVPESPAAVVHWALFRMVPPSTTHKHGRAPPGIGHHPQAWEGSAWHRAPPTSMGGLRPA